MTWASDSVSAGNVRPWELLAAFALSLGIAVIATAADGWPAPRVFDEFAQILAGSTFAHGRLANPPHPLPEFFETTHVLQHPTYASKYFPGHGLLLAVGILLGGGARLGQWIAFATMGPAVLWMLGSWVTRRAAMIGAGILVLLLADTDWASGYWGSPLTVTGSALLFGALPRLALQPRPRHAALMGLGVVLMAFTRPVEGAALCIAPALFVAWWVMRPATEWQQRLRVVLPAALVVAAGGAFLLLQNRAVTGNPLRSGYALYEANAPGAPPFVWQEPQPPVRVLRVNQRARINIDIAAYQRLRESWPREMRDRLFRLTIPYYLPHLAFAFPLLIAPLAIRDRWLALAALGVAAVAGGVGLSSYFLPHYIAPAVPPLVLLYAAGCGVASGLTAWLRPVGRRTTQALLLVLTCLAARDILHRDAEEVERADDRHWSRQREALARHLRSLPGSHVVFVRYGETYRSQNEWVQNAADLSSTRVLWAHDLGDDTNRRLLAMVPERTAWRVVVEAMTTAPPRFGPYGTPHYATTIPLDRLRGELVTPPY